MPVLAERRSGYITLFNFFCLCRSDSKPSQFSLQLYLDRLFCFQCFMTRPPCSNFEPEMFQKLPSCNTELVWSGDEKRASAFYELDYLSVSSLKQIKGADSDGSTLQPALSVLLCWGFSLRYMVYGAYIPVHNR